MSHSVQVMEPVTSENLFPQGYLLANLDVKKSFGATDNAAWEHYRTFGHRERRLQIARGALELLADREFRRVRFERFRNVFDVLPTGANSLPLQFGCRTENLKDYQNKSAHPTSSEFARELGDNPTKIYADIGAGLRNVIYDNCIYVEVYPSLTTDVVVEPGSTLPFRTASLDGLGCFAVLEHVQEPWEMAREFARIVKPGGRIFIDWPFLQPVHGYPSHYYNATPEGLRSLFERDFSISSLQTGPHQGPDFTVHWILNGLLHAIGNRDFRDEVRNMSVAALADEMPQGAFWKRVLKAVGPLAAAEYSCGNTLIGIRKPRV